MSTISPIAITMKPRTTLNLALRRTLPVIARIHGTPAYPLHGGRRYHVTRFGGKVAAGDWIRMSVMEAIPHSHVNLSRIGVMSSAECLAVVQ